MILVSASYYIGILSGMHAANSNCLMEKNSKFGRNKVDDARVETMVRERVRNALRKEKQKATEEEQSEQFHNPPPSKPSAPEARFGPKMSHLAVGMAKTGREDFLNEFDYGNPSDHNQDSGSDEAIILYQSKASLPSDEGRAEAIMHDDGNGLPMLSARDATANCDTLNVVLSRPFANTNQCIALVPSYESAHVQRWMRVDDQDAGKREKKKDLPLRHVGRGMMANQYDQFTPPADRAIQKHWTMLKQYLQTVDGVLAKLGPIAKRTAKDNTIVVMVCNLGQSVLLMNFACSARSKGFDISNVLVFATDKETLDLAQGLGLNAFYDEDNFADLPSSEAKFYGDTAFRAMMYAKVVTVQLISHLGYDLLFQDVDVVWYRNPLKIFHDTTSHYADFDILFQDDGARSVRYAPYSANSGFYYVRNNQRTKYLLTSLLYAGDLIIATASHQQALSALLTEHSSLFGLKVKTLPGEEFPGGYHYHRQKEMMMAIVQQKTTPWLFHMSWTKNMDNKILFFQQMGLWHVSDACVDSNALDLLQNGANGQEGSERKTVSEFATECCSAEPLISCHYRDKPSVIPCQDSPSLDKAGKSFWLVNV